MLLIMLHMGMTEPDYSRSVYLVQKKSEASSENLLEDIPGGKYKALAYDVERDGLILSTFPSTSSEVLVSGFEFKLTGRFYNFMTYSSCSTINNVCNHYLVSPSLEP